MATDLPTTAYIVLGLLSFGSERSGYEIHKAAENLKYFYGSPAHSQIYRELRRLEELALVTSRDVLQAGKPDKKLFGITQQGINVFKDWLADEPLPPLIIKHPVLLKLFFMHMAEPTILVQTLQEYIENVQEALGQLAIVAEFVAEDEESEHTAIIVEWTTHYYEAELAMAQKLLARFMARADGDP